MLNMITTFLTNTAFIKYFKIGIIAAILIFIFIAFLYVKSLKNENIELKKDYSDLQFLYKEKMVEKDQEIVSIKQELENEKATTKDKEIVTDSVSKLKQEIVKRGEIKENEEHYINFSF